MSPAVEAYRSIGAAGQGVARHGEARQAGLAAARHAPARQGMAGKQSSGRGPNPRPERYGPPLRPTQGE